MMGFAYRTQGYIKTVNSLKELMQVKDLLPAGVGSYFSS